MSDDTLFDDAEYRVAPPPDPDEQLSADRRRTLRQADDIAHRRHPLTRGPLHPEASAYDPGREGARRCGNCRFLEAHGRGRTYFKCGAALITHGPATDIRLWWPACVGHVPLEEA